MRVRYFTVDFHSEVEPDASQVVATDTRVGSAVVEVDWLDAQHAVLFTGRIPGTEH